MAIESTALRSAGVTDGTALAAVVAARKGLFEMTQGAEDAVLRPNDPGRWSHALRAAMAARIARLNGEDELSTDYEAAAGEYAELADPTLKGDSGVLAAVLHFMDKVAADTRTVRSGDIEALQAAGVGDADIVRLAELNAFLSYQLRVIAGLRLMQEAGA